MAQALAKHLRTSISGVASRHSVLVIEDDPLIGMLLIDYLEDLGFRVCGTASTEDRAVELATLHQPDLITSDIQLARGDGVTAIRRIRFERWVPVLFVSGSLNNEARMFHDVARIAKPFDIGSLALGIAKATAIDALNLRSA
ncbi:response regulator [Jiella pacifica]|uniref:Response regulator n=1 Tax=Jiella pacifica TaxID=2696469 RepID=A0A6N9TA05_9HYPH|nr:response regulator [Jiella pacifica]NDW07382.1 response regulator [Jiella pacifica]